jgi:hypothetical protein
VHLALPLAHINPSAEESPALAAASLLAAAGLLGILQRRLHDVIWRAKSRPLMVHGLHHRPLHRVAANVMVLYVRRKIGEAVLLRIPIMA